MNTSNYRINLDIHETESGLSLSAKKGDTIRRLFVTLMDGGQPYRITPDCTAAFTARKPDNTIVFNQAQIENNAIVYELTPQTTAAAGQVKCEVRLYGGDGRLITSPRFFLDVDDTVFTEGDEVVSEDEYTILEDAVKLVEDAVADLQRRIENGEFTGPQGPAGVGANPDTTLTLPGEAADAAAVGQALDRKLDKTGGTLTGPLHLSREDVPGSSRLEKESGATVLQDLSEDGECLAMMLKAGEGKALLRTGDDLWEILTDEKPVPVTLGGTGAADAKTARENLGLTLENLGGAEKTHSHAAGDIRTGILPLARGGTGAGTKTAAMAALGGLTLEHMADSANQITSGKDLNTYTTPGVYRAAGADIVKSLTNPPPYSASGMRLIVSCNALAGSVTQLAVFNLIENHVYMRVRSNAGAWGAWQKNMTNVLTSAEYGDALPASGVTGQLFFLKG